MGLNSGSLAFVHARLSGSAAAHRVPHHQAHHRHHHSHHSQPRASFSLHADCKSTLYRARWPWLFEQPGRCINLPAEEIFAGFDGLDVFDDDVNDQTNDRNDYDQSKVTREVRNACHSPVCLDPAPAAEVVVISQTGATLTGIPRVARYPEIGGEGDQQDLNEAGHTEGGGLSQLELKELALALTGTRLLPGSQPFASCYGGHQFGNWAGQLGDGRVATLGEIRAGGSRDSAAGVAATWEGHLVEIQLKGIGKTPYSRDGDGKAVLGACLREYLFSEAFIGLGLAAAVVVSVCSTGQDSFITASDAERRGTLKRASGAVLCRVAPSFLRFGSFELPARRGDILVVRRLADFCLRYLGPHLELPRSTGTPGSNPQHPTEALGKKYDRCATTVDNTESSIEGQVVWARPEDGLARAAENEGKGDVGFENDYLALLVAIIEATARMVAGWQALGFCHGVLNTDNFTLLGLALDFGPCSFMEKYEPGWSPNEGDSALRYTFQNQPDVSAWNCERLAEAFSSLVGVSGVAEADKAFSPAFDSAYTNHLQRKLGLTGMELGSGWVDVLRDGGASPCETKTELSPDARFVSRFFRLMSTCETDFTDTWRALLDVPALSTMPKPTSAGLEVRVGTEGIAEGPASTSVGLDDAGKRAPVRSRNRDSTAKGCCTLDGDGPDVTDEDVLRPLVPVLRAAGVSSDRMGDWAEWTREFMARIDTQGVGRSHPEGAEEGRRERLQVMQTSNPAFVLRAATLDRSIKAAENGDMMLLHHLQERLSRPYEIEDTKARVDSQGR